MYRYFRQYISTVTRIKNYCEQVQIMENVENRLKLGGTRENKKHKCDG